MLPFFFIALALTVVAVTIGVLMDRARAAGAVLAVAFALHAIVVWALASAGVFAVSTLPPRIPLGALATVFLGLTLARNPVVSDALAFTASGTPRPAWHFIALQTFRAPLELGLYLAFREGLMPEQMTFSGQNFDVLVGVTAPVVAWLLATGRISAGVAKVWNALTVGLLINVLRIAITSFPGPLRADWPGEPLTTVAHWPYVLIPMLFVPFAVWGQVLTARALRK